MMKYPIGIQSFNQIMEDGWVYVDKTALVYQLVKTSKICFLSRPRRFGKSLLVSTLECYFKARKELFHGLAMEQLEKDWIEYPVFKIDFNGGNYSEPYLRKLLSHNKEQINDITGKWYEPQMFIDYKADVEKPLPMIYQSGYLTIKEFDLESNEYLLDFPNNEVRSGFLSMIANDY